jgi:hypothetical protein
MTHEEVLREAAKLRLRLRVNNRLRLESLAAISRVFREFQEPITDDLLSRLTLAVPGELPGEGYRQTTSRQMAIDKEIPPDEQPEEPAPEPAAEPEPLVPLPPDTLPPLELPPES